MVRSAYPFIPQSPKSAQCGHTPSHHRERGGRLPLDAGRRVRRADRFGLRGSALPQEDRPGSPWTPRPAARTASSAGSGSRSPAPAGTAPQLTGSCRLPSCSSLNAATPAIDWVSQEARKIAPITRPSELEKTASRQPPALAHRGESAVAYAADLLFLVGLQARLVQALRLRRALLQQPHGQEDVEEELQVLGLPVLRHVGAEAGRGDVPGRTRSGSRPSVICCWLKSACPANACPTSTIRNSPPKTRPERVVPQEALHRCNTPSAVKYTSPTTTTTSSSTNSTRIGQLPCSTQSYGRSAARRAAGRHHPPAAREHRQEHRVAGRAGPAPIGRRRRLCRTRAGRAADPRRGSPARTASRPTAPAPRASPARACAQAVAPSSAAIAVSIRSATEDAASSRAPTPVQPARTSMITGRTGASRRGMDASFPTFPGLGA